MKNFQDFGGRRLVKLMMTTCLADPMDCIMLPVEDKKILSTNPIKQNASATLMIIPVLLRYVSGSSFQTAAKPATRKQSPLQVGYLSIAASTHQV